MCSCFEFHWMSFQTMQKVYKVVNMCIVLLTMSNQVDHESNAVIAARLDGVIWILHFVPRLNHYDQAHILGFNAHTNRATGTFNVSTEKLIIHSFCLFHRHANVRLITRTTFPVCTWDLPWSAFSEQWSRSVLFQWLHPSIFQQNLPYKHDLYHGI